MSAATKTDADFDLYGAPATNMPPDLAAMQAIDDLFDEAKNFADGEPIASEEMADAITKLHDAIHEAGKVAEALRVEEKKPLDEMVKEIQARFNPLIAPGKGKVALAKDTLQALLTPWRAAKAAALEAEAQRKREEAEKAAAEAQEAIRASSGNLEAREAAEGQLEDAKRAGKIAKKADKAASSGLGLRTTWTTTLVDADAALEWAYGRNPQAFADLALDMAKEAVRVNGARSLPGFAITEEKVAI